jgi:hypothetical protein
MVPQTQQLPAVRGCTLSNGGRDWDDSASVTYIDPWGVRRPGRLGSLFQSNKLIVS